MAGCINGVETVEVKAPNGKPSLLFQGLIRLFNNDRNAAYLAYLKTQLPGFSRRLGERQLEDTDRNGEFLLTAENQVFILNQVNNPFESIPQSLKEDEEKP